MKISILVVIFLLFAFILGRGLSPASYKLSGLETYKVFLRTQYFGEELGKVYKNRFGVFFFSKTYALGNKFQTVLFSSFDPVLIFLPLYTFLFIRGYKKIR